MVFKGMVALKLALLTVLACFARAADEHVLVLTSTNFTDVVKSNGKLVVEFYAPWCGHCKKLAPEYAEAAGILKDEGIVLANVDATLDENKELATKYGIRGFPTLKVFRGDPETASEYQGPRDAKGIVSYCKSEFGPPSVQLNTTEEVEEIVKPGDDVAVLGVFDGPEAEGLKVFLEVGNSLRGDAIFRHVVSPSLAPQAEGSPVILIKNFDEEKISYSGRMDKESLTAWIEKGMTPALVSMDAKPANKKALTKIFADNSKPKLIGVLQSTSDNISAFRTKLIAAKEAHSGIDVILLDPKDNPGALNYFGVKAEDTPMLLVHSPQDGAKYSSGTIEIDNVVSWVGDFMAGKVEKLVKSEEPPATNDGPVKIVVGKTFDEIVMSGKNVFIEFYAPWCGHCKKLEPVWTELGEAYKGSDNVVIAKMDATANDVTSSSFNVQGFPTMYFVSASGEVSKYDGGRTLKDLKEFVDSKVGSSDSKDEL